ncbi:MAG: hypothetical protein ACTSXK_05140 [Promethearchaeota archaeon]
MTFITNRKIRGIVRKVKVTRFSRTSESISILDQLSQKTYRKVTRSEVRQAQTKRSKRAKLKDMFEQNKLICKDERWLHDPAHLIIQRSSS